MPDVWAGYRSAAATRSHLTAKNCNISDDKKTEHSTELSLSIAFLLILQLQATELHTRISVHILNTVGIQHPSTTRNEIP
jgi:hypothetical protein